MMISFCYAYTAVFVAAFLGSLFSVLLFGRTGINPLLPDELRTAPIPFYWLVFVALGIVVFLMLIKRKVKTIERNIEA